MSAIRVGFTEILRTWEAPPQFGISDTRAFLKSGPLKF